MPSHLDIRLPKSIQSHGPSSVRPRRRRELQRLGSYRAPRYLYVKLALEWLLALGLFLATLPVLLLVALVVKLSSRGPIFYSQIRVSRKGRPFTIYKIRSMMDRCESLTGPRWSIPGDPRITPVGRWLRKLHLDELPQLINVLRGDMALIGPRPERPEFVAELTEELPAYRDRLAILPGISGLAQVRLPPDTGVVSVERKLIFDLYYIRNMSFTMDLRILFGTGLKMLGMPYPVVSLLAGLPSNHQISRQMRGTARVTDRSWRTAA